jgi:hypothetical protein
MKNIEILGYSLRCPGLLQRLESKAINPMLQYSLFPYSEELQEYGQVHHYPIIYKETTQLLIGLQGHVDDTILEETSSSDSSACEFEVAERLYSE